MALNEACQVWIEQRIEEELSERGDTGKSLREIGRELAAEIERVFEAKVDPITLAMRASRMKPVTNVTPTETPATTPPNAGCTGCRLDPAKVVAKIDKMVEQGKSIREASEAVAEETGKRPSAVRSAYVRERDKLPPEDEPSEAWQFAEIAISQLKRIRRNDPGRVAAFQRVKDWIASQEDK